MNTFAEQFRQSLRATRPGGLLAVGLLIIASPIALADTIQLSVNYSALVNVSSPNDNFYGQYVNVPSLPLLLDYPEARGTVSLPFPNLSLSLPDGNAITSAFLTLAVPSTTVQGTGYVTVPGGQFPGRDPSLPSVAPTFSTTGTSQISIDGFTVTVPAVASGNEVHSNPAIQDFTFDYVGYIESGLEDPGSNWAGYIAGQGQVDVPYSAELDVTYTPVPEPSSIALLGTGILCLVETVRRRRFSQRD